MKEGDKVFIQADASGLGILSIQIAKAYGAVCPVIHATFPDGRG